MGQLLCAELIGRGAELRQLTELVDGHGTAVVLGEPGIGKSRLIREASRAARERNKPVLVGRAVRAVQPVPYRPLAEAIVSACRRYGLPTTSELTPYRSALGRLIPEWHRPELAAALESSIVLGEGVLRLLTAMGSREGALLVVEDIHWADPESLIVLEYLADHAAESRLTLLLTARREPSAGLTLSNALVTQRTATLVELGALPPNEVGLMAADCLGSSPLPPGLSDLLAPAEGVPFLIEELLAAAAGGGVLARDESGWVLRSTGATRVPQRLADTIAQRIGTLDRQDQDVPRVAALFGRQFDPDLVARTLDRPVETLDHVLDRCVGMQLMSTDLGGWHLRHALTGDAILERWPPSARIRLARRARDVLEATHPDLSGQWRQVAAGLALAAGDAPGAAQHLLDAGRQALAEGALVSASRALDLGRDLVAEESQLARDFDEFRAEAAAAAGDLGATIAAATPILRSTTDDARRTRVHIVLAQAASAAGQWPLAKQQLLQVDGADALTQATADAVLAQVELGADSAEAASEAAHRALAAAEQWDLGDAACQSLEVLGRIARLRDPLSAEKVFRRQLEIARTHQLTLWVVRATHELATVEMLATNEIHGLVHARDLASDAGALAMVATLDLQLAASHLMAFDVQACLEATARSQDAARRWDLRLTLAMAWMFEAQAYAIAGSESAMEMAIAKALELDRPEPHVQGAAWAARAALRLLNEDHDAAIAAQDRGKALDAQSANMGCGPHWGDSALLCSVRNREGDQARSDLRARLTTGPSLNAALLAYADAVAAGRSGARADAERLFTDARSRMHSGRGWVARRHLAERLAAESALQDGWGDPIGWLTDAAIFFRGDGHLQVERACRNLLRRVGAPVPRRERHQPITLPAALGITERETDVLTLVAQGLTNREIATRLYISVRTVDKHVERLLAKTGATRRSQLRGLNT